MKNETLLDVIVGALLNLLLPNKEKIGTILNVNSVHALWVLLSFKRAIVL